MRTSFHTKWTPIGASESPTDPSAGQAKFQRLLRELFQFDCADLNFGIHRLMNHKRRILDGYIDRRLPEAIEEAVGRGAIHTEAERSDEFREIREKAIQAFGEGAFAPNGELVEYQEMISGDRQRVAFVEPHGMLHAKICEEDEKAKLHERLPTLAGQIACRSGVAREVSLDSLVVSATEYDELRRRYGDGSWTKEDFARRHILFADRDWTCLDTLLADG